MLRKCQILLIVFLPIWTKSSLTPQLALREKKLFLYENKQTRNKKQTKKEPLVLNKTDTQKTKKKPTVRKLSVRVKGQ